MAVRVRIRIKHGDKVVETAAVANSGYEADEPEVHIPLACARELGFGLSRLRGESYRVVGGVTSAYILVKSTCKLLKRIGLASGQRLRQWPCPENTRSS